MAPFTSPDEVWPKTVRLSVISAANSSAALALNENPSGNRSGNRSGNMDTSLLDVVKSNVGQVIMKAPAPIGVPGADLESQQSKLRNTTSAHLFVGGLTFRYR